MPASALGRNRSAGHGASGPAALQARRLRAAQAAPAPGRYIPVTPARLLVPVAAIAAALALGGPAVGAGENLLANPGAEDGSDPAAGEAQSPPPRGWGATAEFTVAAYGDPGLPATGHAQEVGGGTKLFLGGRCASPPFCATSSAQQELAVSASAAAVDAGSVRAEVAALLGGLGSEPDAGRVLLQFLGAGSERLGQLELGPVTAADRGNQTRLLPRSGERALPAGTRRLRLALLADGEGERIDAFFDNVSLRLTGVSEPPANVTPPAPGTGTGGGGGSGDAGGGSGPATAPVALSSRPVRMTRSGVVSIRVRCARADAPCTGRLAAAAGRRRCGSRRAAIPASRARRLPLRLGAACRRLVARRARGLATTLSFRDGTGAVTSARIVVRRPR